MTSILVAGIGNIFNGDDAFGVEVAQRLRRRALPGQVKVVDFGISGIDLTYALLDGCDAAILVDAAQRGETPGAVSVVAPQPLDDAALEPGDLMLDPHDLDPARVLRLVSALGGKCRRLLLVTCEPATFGGEEGAMGLSPPVAAAVDVGVRMVEDLIEEWLEADAQAHSGATDAQNQNEGARP